NNKVNESIKIAKEYFKFPDSNKDFFTDDIIDYLILLIAKKAYKQTYDLFNLKIEAPSQLKKPNYLTSHLKIDFKESVKNHILKDRFKPVYFALMYYMQKEHPMEYQKMGSELKDTVQEIIEKVEQKRKDYL
ncbi:MAG: hypothetical protein AAGA77_25025, partial [Bacteroidota bacterium]